jgi:phage terminase large subunit
MQVQLTPAQYEIATDQHRYKIICAGRRFGKSTLARLLLLQRAIKHPGLYWIVSPTYTQSVQNHWREMIKEYPREWIAKKYEGRSVTLQNGSIIELKGADDPDSLRGIKLQMLCIDEIASIRYWDWLWKEVLQYTLVDHQSPAVFIGTPKGYNHFYDLFNQGSGNNPQYKSWRFSSYDNPHIKKEEIDQLKLDMAEDVFCQEVLADFRKHTGLVYKDFDRMVHVKELPDFKPVMWLRGLDRGYTNPTAVSVIAVDKDGTWYQTHELYKRQLTPSMCIEELRNLDIVAGVKEYEYETMDSASAGDINEFNQAGFSFIPVSKVSGETNLNYVRFKIQKFADRLRRDKNTGLPRYFVHPRNTETIREFEAYSWPEKKDQMSNESEQPEKLNDHIMDELADLNVMYDHYYNPKERKPWDNKIPGTYIEPSPESDEENNYGSASVEFIQYD